MRCDVVMDKPCTGLLWELLPDQEAQLQGAALLAEVVIKDSPFKLEPVGLPTVERLTSHPDNVSVYGASPPIVAILAPSWL